MVVPEKIYLGNYGERGSPALIECTFAEANAVSSARGFTLHLHFANPKL